MPDPSLFAVTGNPILHSKSPFIFDHFFSQGSIAATYSRIAAHNTQEALSLFTELGLTGMNVTAPFKKELMELMDHVDPVASQIGSINTVVREGKILKGYNTDYSGVVESLKTRGIQLEGRRCVVLGAGGAGRAAVYGLLKEIASVTVVNRTHQKAILLVDQMGCKSEKIENLKSLLNHTDIFISTISPDINVIKKEWLSKELIVFDANYPDSQLIGDAKAAGCTVLKGEEWLFNQAIHAYRYFTGKKVSRLVMGDMPALDFKLQNKKNVSIIGFMGCGKSTIGKIISQRIGFSFKDTDVMIEEKEKKSIPDIFNTNGESYFREKEKLHLKGINKADQAVYACGGGAVLDPSNREILKKNSIVIWLYASIKTSLKRIGKGTRPLLDVKDPDKEAEKIFKKRLPLYFQTADLIVNADKKTDDVVENIIQELNKINLSI